MRKNKHNYAGNYLLDISKHDKTLRFTYSHTVELEFENAGIISLRNNVIVWSCVDEKHTDYGSREEECLVKGLNSDANST